MRKAVWLLGVLAVSATVFGCNSKEGNQPTKGSTSAQKAKLSVKVHNKEQALKYLTGIQNGDKNAMYEATNLTPAIVNDCREKLIYRAKYKLTDSQQKDCEKSIQISGEIDHYISKFRKNLPKSSSFQIIQTKELYSPSNTRISVYLVKITFNKQAEAPIDKTSKHVKEMVIQMYHVTQSANGHWIHEFTFEDKDYIGSSYF